MIEATEWDGNTVSKNCFLKNLPIAAYHKATICAGPSISSSGLRTIFNKSPADFFAFWDGNAQRYEQPEKVEWTMGSAVHTLLLGERWFAQQFAIRPEKVQGTPWDGNRLDCKAWLHEQKAKGLKVITPAQVEDIKGMAISIGKHPLVMAGILRGQIERSLIFRDKKTGIWVRARPDAVPTDSGDTADLKTITAVGDDAGRSIKNYRYDMQGAIIKWAMKEVLGIELSTFSLVFVSKTPPYNVDIVIVDTADLEAAEEDCRTALDVFAHCLKTGEWFGPVGTQRDARKAYFDEKTRERYKFRREFLQREMGR